MDKTVRYAAIAAIVIGILGVGYLYFAGTQGIPIARAQTISENYLDSIGTSDLEIDEIMEFEYNYYVVYSEESTGMGAMEMLIDKTTGRIFPEYGPNMMWNLKYGHGGMMTGLGVMMGGFGGMMGSDYGNMMGGYYPEGYSGDPIGAEEAIEIAQKFLDLEYSGAEADDPHPFYGYYTLHTTMNSKIFGMLSVNAFTGQVWYHNWHGEYISSIERH
jgi:hypothetical protein